MGKSKQSWQVLVLSACFLSAGGLLAAGEGVAAVPAEGAKAADAAKAGDAKADAAAAQGVPGRWVVTLDDGGEITGTIVKKTPALWTVLTDSKVSLEINRDRIRAVKPADPATTPDPNAQPKPPAGNPGGPAPAGGPGMANPGNPPPPQPPAGAPPKGPQPPPPGAGPGGGPGNPGIVPPGGQPFRPVGDNANPPAGGDKPKPRLTLHLKNGESITGIIEKVEGNVVWVRKDSKSEPVAIQKDQIKGEERAP